MCALVKIKSIISPPEGSGGRKFNILVDSMHGVTGPYVSTILVDKLGAVSGEDTLRR